MEVLDINYFLSFKNEKELKTLDSNILELLNNLFNNNNNNQKNKYKKNKKQHILKNHKFQSKKDNISNKVNLILNKLAESNIDNLVVEFLEIIKKVDLETYEEIQKTFYLKMLSEISFIKIYLQFLKIIAYIYKKVQNYDLSFLYSIIEAKFKSDYLDIELEYDFFDDIDNETQNAKYSEESRRLNNLIIIKNMVDYNFLDNSLINYCDNIIINQENYLSDIYYWFNSKNKELTEDNINKVKLILNKKIGQRERVLLENLINKKQIIENDIISVKNIPTKINDTLKLECDNIIEEYLLIKSIDDVKYFINNRCNDAITKNKFCEYLINIFILSNESNIIIDLFKKLLKDQTLYKSNISRGIIMVNNNHKSKNKLFNDKIKLLLQTMKQLNITKGIEYLIEQYKI